MIHFQASVSKGWLYKNGGFVFERRYYADPLYRLTQDREINEFIGKKITSFPVYNMEANLMQADYLDENQVLVGGIQPNLILAIVLGAELVAYPDKDADVLGNPLKDIQSANDLPSNENSLDHPFIRELADQIRHIQDTHPEYDVIPPFFWDRSGRATIHGILTTSQKLLGEKALILTMMDPELLHAVHHWITEVYISLITYFSEMIDFPITSVHVGECSGTMISGDQYAEFVTPYVSQLGKTLGKIRLHSCGPSDHILGAISDIENLSVIDTGSDTSVAAIRKAVGIDFEINLEPPIRLMSAETNTEEVITWLDRILEENQNGPLKLAFHIEPDYSIRNCEIFYKELIKRKLIATH